MYKMDIENLLTLRGTIENIRVDLTPAAIKGDIYATAAREYLFDLINDLRSWEGKKITPEQITFAITELDRAREVIEGIDEDIDYRLTRVFNALEKEESAAVNQ